MTFLLRFFFLLLFGAASLSAAGVSAEFIQSYPERLEKVFSSLDPDNPWVGPIRSQWEAGQKAEAASALASYYFNKSIDPSLLESLPEFANRDEQAKAALENRFWILEDWQAPADPDANSINWKFRGPRNDKEVAWMLNRHQVFPVLADAYRKSRDDRYKVKLNQLWTDWILGNPYPDRLTFSAPWRPLEAARRILNSWTHVFYSPSLLHPETRLLVLSSILDHGDSLFEHGSFWGGNHLISEKLALLTLAYAWPEFRQAGQWKQYSIDSLSAQFLRQTYPDGSYKELSNHYQRVVLVNAHLFLKLLAVMKSDYKSMPVVSRIEAMWDFFARSMRPDGYGPLNNASDREVNAHFIKQVWEYYERPDWRYIATNGAEGIPPSTTPTSFFPWAGQVFLRSGWDRLADWVYFDAGPYGTAHQHVDRLHLSASLKGRPVLVDNGRYTYQPGKWKQYFQGPSSHNVLLLDGKPARQAPRAVDSPLPIVVEERENLQFIAARATFPANEFGHLLPSMQAPVQWARAVLYFKEGFVVIVDHLLTYTRHHLEANWNFHPVVPESEAPLALRLAWAQEPLSLSLRHGSESLPLGGFFSPDYHERIPSVRLRFTGEIRSPTILVWILQDPQDPPVQVYADPNPSSHTLSLTLEQPGRSSSFTRLRLYPKIEVF